MAEPDATFHTADMVRALIDEERAWPRYETLYGELVVTPSPRIPHQEIAGELFGELRAYLQRERIGKAFTAPADISWGRTDVLVQPDVFVVPIDDARAARAADDWAVIRHLLLAVEILSPSTARRDRFAKRRLYQQQGVPLYWVLDADDRSAAVWTPEAELPQVERERLVWHPAGASTSFTVALAALYDA
ncbi:MAG: Uma2 family endonuclease [Gemmatirosa sp.]|nr:Uma2 family endonuclease [Gemmatirosa sp.]